MGKSEARKELVGGLSFSSWTERIKESGTYQVYNNQTVITELYILRVSKDRENRTREKCLVRFEVMAKYAW